MSATSAPSRPGPYQLSSVVSPSVGGACLGRVVVSIPFLSSDFQLLIEDPDHVGTVNFQPSYPTNSFRLNLFADPYPLNPAVSILYKNSGGRGQSGQISTSRHGAPLSHLESTLMRRSTSVDSNGLTGKLTCLESTLMKNREGGPVIVRGCRR